MERRLRAADPDRARAVILRISNAYGPGQRLGKGQGVIGHWMAAAARGEPLHVYGDPAATRDYIYVDDVVEAMETVLALDQAVDVPAILNIGSGVPTALGELAEIVAELVGGAKIIHEPGRAFDVRDTWLDVRLARDTVGWVPRTPLVEGLARTWAHVSRG